jgi:membrane-bound serine protease (ClpP class)
MQPIITNPNIALLLIVAGVLGISVEFCRPGLIAPGVLGSVCVLVGIASLAAFPIHSVGTTFIVLSVLALVTFALVIGFLLSVAARARRNKLKS